jgi:GntR family transcriptional regulator
MVRQTLGAGRGLLRNSPIPLYYQLLEALQEQIASGVWRASEALPSEAELCRVYEVSRTVARQALDGLERVGLIYRVKGKGAFISERKLMAYMLQDPNGFCASIAAQGLDLVTRILQHDIIPAPPEVAEALQLPVGAKVVRLERLRSVHGEPIFFGTTFLPGELGRDLTETDLSQSVNEVLARRYGLRPGRGKRVVETMGAGQREAQWLGVPTGLPLFRLYAVTYDQHGRPMEHSVAWLRGDRFAFEVNLVTQTD